MPPWMPHVKNNYMKLLTLLKLKPTTSLKNMPPLMPHVKINYMKLLTLLKLKPTTLLQNKLNNKQTWKSSKLVSPTMPLN
jgi:hypothetical protein